MDLLFRNPYTSSRGLVESIGTSLPTANGIIERFASVGVVREVSGRRRNRLYHADGISGSSGDPAALGCTWPCTAVS